MLQFKWAYTCLLVKNSRNERKREEIIRDGDIIIGLRRGWWDGVWWLLRFRMHLVSRAVLALLCLSNCVCACVAVSVSRFGMFLRLSTSVNGDWSHLFFIFTSLSVYAFLSYYNIFFASCFANSLQPFLLPLISSHLFYSILIFQLSSIGPLPMTRLDW